MPTESYGDFGLGARVSARDRPALATARPAARLTPGSAADFTNIRQALPDLAGAPKPGKPGPGRPPGSTKRQATRHEVGKSVKRDQPEKKTRRQKGYITS